MINEQITKNQYKKSLGAGVVLTGGSSMLSGIQELAEQIFDLPVRIGTPIGVEGLAEIVDHPKYATGVGLLLLNKTWGFGGVDRTSRSDWWQYSLQQLKKAIASFI